MHLTLPDKIIKQYWAEKSLPRDVRPTRCKDDACIEQSRFHRHGSYPRKSVFVQGIGWLANLTVQRYRCARCGKTFSIILPSHYKWQRANLSLQQAVALGLCPLVSLLVHFSKRTLQRWRQKWNAWAQALHAVILGWILYKWPDASLNADKQTSAGPLVYLAFLLNQIPSNRHGPATVTAVARFGGASRRATTHNLSLSLAEAAVVSCSQGRAHLNPTIRGEPE